MLLLLLFPPPFRTIECIVFLDENTNNRVTETVSWSLKRELIDTHCLTFACFPLDVVAFLVTYVILTDASLLSLSHSSFTLNILAGHLATFLREASPVCMNLAAVFLFEAGFAWRKDENASVKIYQLMKIASSHSNSYPIWIERKCQTQIQIMSAQTRMTLYGIRELEKVPNPTLRAPDWYGHLVTNGPTFTLWWSVPKLTSAPLLVTDQSTMKRGRTGINEHVYGEQVASFLVQTLLFTVDRSCSSLPSSVSLLPSGLRWLIGFLLGFLSAAAPNAAVVVVCFSSGWGPFLGPLLVGAFLDSSFFGASSFGSSFSELNRTTFDSELFFDTEASDSRELEDRLAGCNKEITSNYQHVAQTWDSDRKRVGCQCCLGPQKRKRGRMKECWILG